MRIPKWSGTFPYDKNCGSLGATDPGINRGTWAPGILPIPKISEFLEFQKFLKFREFLKFQKFWKFLRSGNFGSLKIFGNFGYS